MIPPHHLRQSSSIIAPRSWWTSTSLGQFNITPQPALRQQGFGGHFKDTPPTYIAETKTDNKIERVKKPDEKKKKVKTKKKDKDKN